MKTHQQTLSPDNPEEAKGHVIKYIDWMGRMVVGKMPKRVSNAYYSTELLYSHSAFCKPALKPSDVPWGRKQQCFRNALELASENPDYTYVEGYAFFMIPIHHAWVVDRSGNVIDNTWDELGSCYRGVPFTLEAITRSAVESKVYSVLFNMALGNTRHADVDWECLKLLRDPSLQLIAQDL